ncbi:MULTISPECIES: hypothetical protein [Acinetobacter]|jgi:hypothetical protein|uniref:hypothetical protein n=1 Tax=Acinetobacter TaxID=469 RepID=UPI00241F556D|nr:MULTISPECIES: hypothetical protein [Acinetobacter]MEC8568778.1 hypothetical protein [Pseudomonadota bacterium]HJP46215.1 hypothetical protein [Acinetobacter venetianus]|tara:strand:+ start:480 stop:656 length:177 start_codon:yes stop_codon:yes gene_type:complete
MAIPFLFNRDPKKILYKGMSSTTCASRSDYSFGKAQDKVAYPKMDKTRQDSVKLIIFQ